MSLNQHPTYSDNLNGFIHSIVVESQDSYNKRRGDGGYRMSEETVDQHHLREMNYTLKVTTESLFSSFIKNNQINNCPVISLLLVPSELGSDQYLSTNAVMNMVTNAQASDRDKVEFIAGNVIPDAFKTIQPTLHRVAHFFATDYQKKSYSLAEMYWLLELSTWLSHATPWFSTKLQEVLVNGETHDFAAKLSPDNETHAVLINAAAQQYAVLEQLLKRM